MEPGSNRMETDEDSNAAIQVVHKERSSVQMNLMKLPFLSAARHLITENMEMDQNRICGW